MTGVAFLSGMVALWHHELYFWMFLVLHAQHSIEYPEDNSLVTKHLFSKLIQVMLAIKSYRSYSQSSLVGYETTHTLQTYQVSLSGHPPHTHQDTSTIYIGASLGYR